MKRQAGFTLIELIVVIVILGILAATALPKFVDISKDAKIAVIKSADGALRSANALIYAKAATAGFLTAGPTAITINGVAVNTTFGYAQSLTELLKVTDIDTTTVNADFVNADPQLQHKKATTLATCGVTLGAPTLTTSPTYTTVTTGC